MPFSCAAKGLMSNGRRVDVAHRPLDDSLHSPSQSHGHGRMRAEALLAHQSRSVAAQGSASPVQGSCKPDADAPLSPVFGDHSGLHSLDTTAPESSSLSHAAATSSCSSAGAFADGRHLRSSASHADTSAAQASRSRLPAEPTSRIPAEQPDQHPQSFAPMEHRNLMGLFGEPDHANQLRSLAEEFKVLSAALAAAHDVEVHEASAQTCATPTGAAPDLNSKLPGRPAVEDLVAVQERRDALLEELESRVGSMMQREVESLSLSLGSRLEERLASAMQRFDACMQNTDEAKCVLSQLADATQRFEACMQNPTGAARSSAHGPPVVQDLQDTREQSRTRLENARAVDVSPGAAGGAEMATGGDDPRDSELHRAAPGEVGMSHAHDQWQACRQAETQREPQPSQPVQYVQHVQHVQHVQVQVQQQQQQQQQLQPHGQQQPQRLHPTPTQLAACGVLQARLVELLDPSPEEQMYSAICRLKAAVGSMWALRFVQARAKSFLAQQQLASLARPAKRRPASAQRLVASRSRSSSRLRDMLADALVNQDIEASPRAESEVAGAAGEVTQAPPAGSQRPAHVPRLQLERVRFGETDVMPADATMHPQASEIDGAAQSAHWQQQQHRDTVLGQWELQDRVEQHALKQQVRQHRLQELQQIQMQRVFATGQTRQMHQMQQMQQPGHQVALPSPQLVQTGWQQHAVVFMEDSVCQLQQQHIHPTSATSAPMSQYMDAGWQQQEQHMHVASNKNLSSASAATRSASAGQSQARASGRPASAGISFRQPRGVSAGASGRHTAGSSAASPKAKPESPSRVKAGRGARGGRRPQPHQQPREVKAHKQPQREKLSRGDAESTNVASQPASPSQSAAQHDSPKNASAATKLRSQHHLQAIPPARRQRPQSSPAMMRPRPSNTSCTVVEPPLPEQEAMYFLRAAKEKIACEWPPMSKEARGKSPRPRSALAPRSGVKIRAGMRSSSRMPVPVKVQVDDPASHAPCQDTMADC